MEGDNIESVDLKINSKTVNIIMYVYNEPVENTGQLARCA